MRLLLDSHTIIWAADHPAKLPATPLALIQDPAHERQTNLPWHHRDPFDRLLAAQALVEGVTLVSGDAVFDQYGVLRIWT